MTTVDHSERVTPLEGSSASLQQSVSIERKMLDALTAHVSLLDSEGRIVAVNSAWRRFGEANALADPDASVGQNYVDICERADGPFAVEASGVAAGLRAVLRNEQQSFSVDYPCHGPGVARWFRLTLTAVESGAVAMHVDITAERLAAQELDQQQALLATAMRVGRMGSWAFDIAQQKLWWSSETYALFGVTPDELDGKLEAFRALVLEEDRSIFDGAYARALTHSDGVFELEYRILRPDGAVRWMFERGHTESDALLRPTRRLGIVMDVTERQLADVQRRELLALEQAARQQSDAASRYYRSLFESAPGCYLVLTPDDFSIVAASDEFLETTDTTRAQLLGRPLFECFPEDPTDKAADGEKNLRASFERVKLTGVSDSMAVQRHTLRRRTETGDVYEERFWSSINCPVPNADGAPAYIIHRTQDVTDHVRRRTGQTDDALPKLEVHDAQLEIDFILHAQELERAHTREVQSQASLRIAGRVAKLGGWLYSIGDKVLTWSDETAVIHDEPCGFSPPDAERAIDYFTAEHRERIGQAFTACIMVGTPFDLEVQIVTAKARRRWVRAIGESVRDKDGKVTHVQGAFQDVTQRKALELHFLRSQRIESIGSLAGGIAHDLNNTLAPILFSASALRADARDPAVIEDLTIIQASAQRAADMVRRLLSFARGADVQRDKIDLRAISAETQKLVRDTFPKNISLALKLADEPCAVDANETQMHQVVTNLCVNARDAMPNGGTITITVGSVVLDELQAELNIGVKPGPFVLLQVDDTGSGIPPEVIDRIFDPFFTTKAVGSGTGLGLSTVHSIVRDHDGFVQVYSEVGKGTRISVYMPAGKAATPEKAPVRMNPDAPHGNGELVLVVDDEEMIRRAIRRTLERSGYKVMLAANGEEAVSLYTQHGREIAVVLTDMTMPGMSGQATIVALRKLDPAVRIIGSSGFNAGTNIPEAKIVHFVAKPYTAAEMLTVLKTVLAEPR